jgi:DNA end-binding protein Ku
MIESASEIFPTGEPSGTVEVSPLMRPVWKGSISFGLVTIPVALHNATRHEELKFRMLRAADLSPINYKRVAETDGKEVPWDQIVKGYEYEKGKFVVLKDEDFKRVDLEATDTIDIMDFVDVDEINPIFFYKPYYLEPQRGGGGAYALLRDVLAKKNRTGIAKIVIRNRQHLAGVKANGSLLVLELMHFAHELVSADGIKVPDDKKIGAREIEMATTLVEQMTEKWDPERYKDDYTSALMKLIEQKVESGGKELPTEKSHRKAPTNVIDLVAVLQKSLQETGRAGGKSTGHAKDKSPPKRKSHKTHKKAA